MSRARIFNTCTLLWLYMSCVSMWIHGLSLSQNLCWGGEHICPLCPKGHSKLSIKFAMLNHVFPKWVTGVGKKAWPWGNDLLWYCGQLVLHTRNIIETVTSPELRFLANVTLLSIPYKELLLWLSREVNRHKFFTQVYSSLFYQEKKRKKVFLRRTSLEDNYSEANIYHMFSLA